MTTFSISALFLRSSESRLSVIFSSFYSSVLSVVLLIFMASILDGLGPPSSTVFSQIIGPISGFISEVTLYLSVHSVLLLSKSEVCLQSVPH